MYGSVFFYSFAVILIYNNFRMTLVYNYGNNKQGVFSSWDPFLESI